MKLWKPDGTLLRTLGTHPVEAWAVDSSPDGTFIVSGSADNTAKLWAPQGQLLHHLKGHQDAVYAVAVSPNGRRIASGSIDGMIKLWNPEGKLLKTLQTKSSDNTAIFSLCFDSRNIKLFAASDNGTVQQWDVSTGRLLNRFHAGVNLRAATCSPTDQQLITADGNGKVKLWDTRSNQVIQSWTSNLKGDGFLNIARFSPDGQTLALTTWDQRLETWSITLWTVQGQQLTTLVKHQGEIRAIAFSPDGKTLVSGSFDQTMAVWDIEQILQLDSLDFACSWIEDYLKTNQELKERDRALCSGITRQLL
ncbi:MAG: WD40 repeat domain-containing protein [Oscillatoriales cyanobacterium RM1_1_9]|nr:WD40 repeat domain-containing protein [Oscillatoriales cyanobacterium SM2_3_0]NJO71485.1 WD40 repeat domain-containing protein [Oscillatoriales cyanobacterium RM1_1_9]